MTRERSSPGGILGPTAANSGSDLVAKFGFLLPNTLLHTLLHFSELYRTTPALHSLQMTFTSTMQSILLHIVGVPCYTINHHFFVARLKPQILSAQHLVLLYFRLWFHSGLDLQIHNAHIHSPLNHSQISLKIFQSSRDS